jgi:hydrogenase expression/formation protein HypC
MPMCLAAPCTIKKIYPDGSGRVVCGGVETDIRLDLIDDPALGDTVLVHAGFAIQKLGESESKELLALWDEMDRAAEASMSHA